MPTIKTNRSELYPPGTVVQVYPRHAVKRSLPAQTPSGTPLSNATVAADGSLTITVPAKTAWALWANVGGEHRVVEGGDPTSDAPAPTLRERLANQRALAKV